ncbi:MULTISPECIES: thiaminase II [unclassified Haladaptatus]|uniref:thiaminase II n=1 Tax=unclassified Haladaptatus TaxID=2622732 RepID=UPI0023E77E88|nr:MULTISPECIES: thiaminase II [unclassified Haladaptatus]
MSFAESLCEEGRPILEAILDHPMVVELGEGTLSTDPFEYWVKQDYVYLVDYSRVFALGAANAPSLDEMGTFATLLEETVNTEMDLHREYAAEFGISEADLERTKPSPTTQAYTDFLVRTAATESFGNLVAALLPCMWGFNQTGRHLDVRGKPDHEQYAAWIEMYASEEFTELTEWCLDLLDEVAGRASPADREQFTDRFLTSFRYEYRFWDAAWREEQWSV